MTSSPSTLTILLILTIAGIVEMCGNVATTSSDTGATTTKGPGRKRRDVFTPEVVHIELLTTLTDAGDVEFSRIENIIRPAYENLLEIAHRQISTGNDGASVMKYMISGADCGEAQLFARAIKDTTSFVTGGIVRCNDQISTF